LAENSPYFEMFKSMNYEVLFAYDAADETVFLSLPQYRMKQLQSVDNWAKTECTDESSSQKLREAGYFLAQSSLALWKKEFGHLIFLMLVLKERH
uniref:Heat shock protein 75 kDa, mitochondrial (inferred by orthology to a human protein) n=1 Tax=Anisakis simplex TaxID=6269 RepID=A0A0M3JH87_ANISI